MNGTGDPCNLHCFCQQNTAGDWQCCKCGKPMSQVADSLLDGKEITVKANFTRQTMSDEEAMKIIHGRGIFN